jgi:PhnB protein
MNANANVKPVADGVHTLTPHLICAGAADAMDFYKKAFGATEMMRVPGPDGRLMHGSVKIGDSLLMLVDEAPEWGALSPKALNGSPVTIHLSVPDVDAAIEKAVAAGATLAMPAADMFWGDRYGVIVDPFGHKWSVATHIRDMTQDEIVAAGREAMEKMRADAGKSKA